MEVLFVFLKWVASFAHLDEETGNMMDLSNLATVICPSIMYSRGRDAVRDKSLGSIRVITELLVLQDELYIVPQEFLPILSDQEYFSSSMELPSKEFLKKCDTYMRLKSSGRPPAVFNNPNINGSNPRLGPHPDRPAMAPSDRNVRPPGVPQSASYPSLPQGGGNIIQGVVPQPPQGQRSQDDWSSTPSTTSIRPTSFVAPHRSSGEHSPTFAPNGHPQAVRQRT
jgi:hypothetical protein